MGELPDPDSETVNGELVALLVMVTLPELLPVVVGANVTLSTVDCPAARVSGTVRPVKLNPVPLTLAWETNTLEFPELVRARLCAVLVPVVMLPKLSDMGEAES